MPWPAFCRSGRDARLEIRIFVVVAAACPTMGTLDISLMLVRDEEECCVTNILVGRPHVRGTSVWAFGREFTAKIARIIVKIASVNKLVKMTLMMPSKSTVDSLHVTASHLAAVGLSYPCIFNVTRVLFCYFVWREDIFAILLTKN